MLEIIAHRGFWNEPSEQNSIVAFERALEHGFGIETDLRDYRKNVVISHDMADENAPLLREFLNIVENINKKVTLALNVKSDGLQSEIIKHNVINPCFYFDMSIPDSLGYVKNDMCFYSRYSNLEPEPSLYEDCKGIWLDNFKDDKLDISALRKFVNDGKSVVLVSPELHKKCEKKYWEDLKKFLTEQPNSADQLGICTDFPLRARDYFNDN